MNESSLSDHSHDNIAPRHVVIGAGGFLGRALCDGLLRRGVEVLAIGPGLVATHPNLKHYNKPIRTRDEASDLLKCGDVVFDAVGTTTPATLGNFSDDIGLQELHVHAAVVDGAIRAKVHKLVLVSSGGTVYGDPLSAKPIIESHPVAPQSPYGVTKVQIEEVFKSAARTGRVDTIIGRLSNPYGPGQIRRRAQGLIATLFENTINNQPTQIWGDGGAVRDYIFVDDARDALIEAADLPQGSIFHVSSGIGRTARDVVSSVAYHLQREPVIVYHTDAYSGVAYSVLSNAFITSSVSWRARTGWETGLAKTAAWWLNGCR